MYAKYIYIKYRAMYSSKNIESIKYKAIFLKTWTTGHQSCNIKQIPPTSSFGQIKIVIVSVDCRPSGLGVYALDSHTPCLKS